MQRFFFTILSMILAAGSISDAFAADMPFVIKPEHVNPPQKQQKQLSAPQAPASPASPASEDANEFQATLVLLENGTAIERTAFFKKQLELVLNGTEEEREMHAQELGVLVSYLESKAYGPEEREELQKQISLNKKDGIRAYRKGLFSLAGACASAACAIAAFIHGDAAWFYAGAAGELVVGGWAFWHEDRSVEYMKKARNMEEALRLANGAEELLKELDRAAEELQLQLPPADRAEFLEVLSFDRRLAAAEQKALPAPTEETCNDLFNKR